MYIVVVSGGAIGGVASVCLSALPSYCFFFQTAHQTATEFEMLDLQKGYFKY